MHTCKQSTGISANTSDVASNNPFFMVCAYAIIFGRTYANSTCCSLIPTICGVAFATLGDYDFTLFGFLMIILGVLLATTKSIASNRIMTGSLAFSAFEVLLWMSPLAAIQSLCYCWATSEFIRILAFVGEGHLTMTLIFAIAENSVVAFALNVSSFQTNKVAGALTLTVTTNLKQFFTILLNIFLFDFRVGLLNGVGMVITLVGAGIYSKVELASRGKK